MIKIEEQENKGGTVYEYEKSKCIPIKWFVTSGL